MNLFKSFSGKREKPIYVHKHEAVLILAYILYGKDASNTLEYGMCISTLKKFHPNHDQIDLADNFSLYDAMLLVNKKEDVISACISEIPNENRESAFAYLVDGILSDGVLTNEEETTISLIKEEMNISDSVASKIIEVMLIKNKDVTF